MPDDVKRASDAKLSEADVERVLQRAVEIDGARSVMSLADLRQAAQEAGISEHAVLQAVEELLQDREMMSPADPAVATSGEARVRSGHWRAAAITFLLVVALMVILFSVRIAP